MTPNPSVILAEARIEEAVSKFAELDCRHLPVLSGARLVGVLSSKDVAYIRPGSAVNEVMSRNPETVKPDSAIEVAAATMAFLKVSCLLVVEDEQLVGIVTTYDLLDAFARAMRRLKSGVPALGTYAPSPPSV